MTLRRLVVHACAVSSLAVGLVVAAGACDATSQDDECSPAGALRCNGDGLERCQAGQCNPGTTCSDQGLHTAWIAVQKCGPVGTCASDGTAGPRCEVVHCTKNDDCAQGSGSCRDGICEALHGPSEPCATSDDCNAGLVCLAGGTGLIVVDGGDPGALPDATPPADAALDSGDADASTGRDDAGVTPPQDDAGSSTGVTGAARCCWSPDDPGPVVCF